MKNSEFIQFTTSDKLTLPGLLFCSPNSKKVAIYLHGNGSNSVFYYDEYFLAEELLKKEISLLMFNNRGAHIIKKINVGKERRRINKNEFCIFFIYVFCDIWNHVVSL